MDKEKIHRDLQRLAPEILDNIENVVIDDDVLWVRDEYRHKDFIIEVHVLKRDPRSKIIRNRCPTELRGE